MTEPLPQAIAVADALQALTFLADRTPTNESDDYYAQLADYRDGAIFVAHYAGSTSWERHGKGDEIVMVLEGATNLILLIDDEEIPNRLSANELLVVPQGVWHRFETPEGVKVLSVTPQPTDHRIDRP